MAAVRNLYLKCGLMAVFNEPVEPRRPMRSLVHRSYTSYFSNTILKPYFNMSYKNNSVQNVSNKSTVPYLRNFNNTFHSENFL
jgi:hypothetical protein